MLGDGRMFRLGWREEEGQIESKEGGREGGYIL